jgi:MFS transporter, PAT family, beta-lactamase induction signal transducer AmpG
MNPSPSPWRWIPSLYLLEGLPYAAVMTLSVVMYKNLGVSNTAIALYTSWLYLPWVLKPLWSPLVDLLGTPRRWVLGLQFMLGIALALIAFTLPGPWPLRSSLALFWLIAFASATHDIAADGFYIQALSPTRQAAFVGVRSTGYRLAMIGAQGGLVVLAGWLQERQGSPHAAWAMVFGLLAAVFLLFAAWHLWALPVPAAVPADAARPAPSLAAARRIFVAWFRRPDIGRILAFLLLYRLAEAQLLKLVVPFLLDAPSAGGLGLSTQQVGVAYGTVGIAALTVGGLLGGWVIARCGVARVLWPLMFCMHVPNLLFVALATWQPSSLPLVSLCIAVEQFGYGFGFTAYMVLLIRWAEGPHRVAHYAVGTGFMALGMMLPGMAAGWLQSRLGYLGFFTWVCVAALPSFVAAAALRLGRAPQPVPAPG